MRYSDVASEKDASESAAGMRPNMRLKLAGLSLLKESEWWCPGGHGTVVHFSCAGGLAARSLRAIP